jgi:signal transduction histidine kinase
MVGTDLGSVLRREMLGALDRHAPARVRRRPRRHRGRRGSGDLDVPNLNRILHWEARATRDAAGRTTGLTITLHDVTQEREIAQMKSDFVSFATHQLRHPLSGIKWMLELAMQETDVPETAFQLYEGRARRLQRLIQLVNDLLDISRLESGRLKTTPQLVDLVS